MQCTVLPAHHAQPIRRWSQEPRLWNLWWLFPPYVLYRALRAICSRLFGNWAGHTIVKASQPHYVIKHPRAGLKQHTGHVSDADLFSFVTQLAEQKNKKDGMCAQRFQVHVPQREHVLDTLVLRDQQGIDHTTQAVLIVSGNTVLYEHDYALHRMMEDLAPNTVVLAFNYPGVGSSTGHLRSSQVLEDAVLAELDVLLSWGIAPENIKVRGHSLGGGVASRVVAYAHTLGLPLYLFNDRSYARLTGAIQGYLEEWFVKRGWPRVGALCAGLALPGIQILAHLLHWEINALDAYLSIDAGYTDLCVLRTSRQERAAHHPFRGDDRNLLYPISLYHALKHHVPSSMKNSRHQLKKKIDRLFASNTTTAEEKKRLKAFRQQLRWPKITHHDPQHNAHGTQWGNLSNRFDGESVAHSNYLAFKNRSHTEHWLVQGEAWVEGLCRKYKPSV